MPPKGTCPLNPFIKRKKTNKFDRPSKKPKVVTGSIVREAPLSTKLPLPYLGKRERFDDGSRSHL